MSDVAKGGGTLAFGLAFIAAARTGVDALGTVAAGAASAFVENGQNAFAPEGRSARVKANAINTNAVLKEWLCDFIGEQGGDRGSGHTKMAYIPAYISHFFRNRIINR